MHVHILGICGTFMGGIALLARSMGHQVSGSDENVYPPMSTQLEEAGITLMQGYLPEHLKPEPDVVVVGNALSRGNLAIESLLDSGIRYTSGPQWLAEHVLKDRWVLAVSGTHGKTSTASLLAWILEDAGLAPGFLIGGVPQNFGISARLGNSPFFVVEADEYDTAFFDKRSKFVHYHPLTLIINNLEFDHADIFDNLAMIQRQFHHLVRTVPSSGLIICPFADKHVDEVIEQGCWTPVECFSSELSTQWRVDKASADGGRFRVVLNDQPQGEVSWGLTGQHNVNNALAAIAAAAHAGVPTATAIEALSRFRHVKRRMELKGEVRGVRVYDDFAHHPTAIATTLAGLRAQVGHKRIIAVLEPRSNTMRMGTLSAKLPDALKLADVIYIFSPDELGWDASSIFYDMGDKVQIEKRVTDIVESIAGDAGRGDQVLVMSNGSFDNIHQQLLDQLAVA